MDKGVQSTDCTPKGEDRMNRLDVAMQIIEEHYKSADCGIFNTRNILGGKMSTIYCDGELAIDICHDYAYFEVFGLSEPEFYELRHFYNTLTEED